MQEFYASKYTLYFLYVFQNANPPSQLASPHTFFHQDNTEPEHTKVDKPIKPDPPY